MKLTLNQGSNRLSALPDAMNHMAKLNYIDVRWNEGFRVNDWLSNATMGRLNVNVDKTTNAVPGYNHQSGMKPNVKA